MLPNGIPCPEPAHQNLWVIFPGRYPWIIRREKVSIPVDTHKAVSLDLELIIQLYIYK